MDRVAAFMTIRSPTPDSSAPIKLFESAKPESAIEVMKWKEV
jgi:hypothetical protein